MRAAFLPSPHPCPHVPRFNPSLRAASAPQRNEPAAVTIRQSADDSELLQVAQMRAEAYHENDFSRFKNSFIKQFAATEHKRLAKAAAAAAAADFVPLLAVDAAGACVGSLDVRPGYVPADAAGPAAYVNNVVVAPAARGRGVGRQLVEAAQALAAGPMGADYLYAHVDSVNDTAAHLYRRCGFAAVGTQGGVGGGAAVGQQTLLRCSLRPAAEPADD